MDWEFLLREPHKKYSSQRKVVERLLHCIWSEQLFRKTLNLNGQEMVVSSPGWWNLEAGPDFRNAEIFLDGKRHAGDVEIHTESKDWYRHGHNQDPRYNSVILHVVLHKSQENCMRQDGFVIPELEMKEHLLKEIRYLQRKLNISEFPFSNDGSVRLCRRFIEEQEPSAVEKILDSAGDLRMKIKKDRYLQTMEQQGFLQALYEGIMEGMGYKQSRYAFRELAKRLPIGELLQLDRPTRRGIDAMAAALLGCAGLLPDEFQVPMDNDRETYFYLEELRHYWIDLEARFGSRRLIGFTWYPSSSRPANFPARRLTAVAAFFHYHGNQLLRLLLHPIRGVQKATNKEIRTILTHWLDLFARPVHIYWSYHYLFDGNKFISPKRLIGRERGKILTVNVLIPCLLAHADIQKDRELECLLHSIYRRHPRLAQNSITRLMEHRLFGEPERTRGFVTTAHRQQALHHFFYDFCDNQETCCSRCDLRGNEARSPDSQQS